MAKLYLRNTIFTEWCNLFFKFSISSLLKQKALGESFGRSIGVTKAEYDLFEDHVSRVKLNRLMLLIGFFLCLKVV